MLLGSTLEESLSQSLSLSQTLGAMPDARDASITQLGAELRDSRRQVRAAALASVAQEVAFAISEVTLR
ncbi:hypothetical protein AKJ09_03594 [Labilithrix luteola]|uniref:Uncharacterized protein n=1 Tax=Labilithrix luteola TaxID=1391654 RepID=A0A0K1PTS1_9BACT|nr:hypothetical protein AKJ09_03594 [Labilithrix luteola]